MLKIKKIYFRDAYFSDVELTDFKFNYKNDFSIGFTDFYKTDTKIGEDQICKQLGFHLGRYFRPIFEKLKKICKNDPDPAQSSFELLERWHQESLFIDLPFRSEDHKRKLKGKKRGPYKKTLQNNLTA